MLLITIYLSVTSDTVLHPDKGRLAPAAGEGTREGTEISSPGERLSAPATQPHSHYILALKHDLEVIAHHCESMAVYPTINDWLHFA